LYFDSYKIDWEKILDIESTLYDNLKKDQQKTRWKRTKTNLLYSRPSIPKTSTKSDFFFFKSMKRDDYNQQFQVLLNLCDDTSYLDLIFEPKKKRGKYPFYVFFKYFPLLIKNFQFDFRKMTYMIMNQIKYLEVAEKIFKNRFNLLIVYADMQPFDNMLCQYAQKKGIETVTIQHGLYVNYEKDPNINCVNYRNQVAKYFLSWGDETARLIQEFHPDTKIIICGKPLKRINTQRDQSYFSVVFDQRIFQEYNIKLLKIATLYAKEHNLTINLKLHPSNKISEYSINSDIIKFDKNIENSLFVLGHTTSLLYELMRQGIPTYKLHSSIACNDIDDSLTFTSYEELLLKIQEKNQQNFDFSNYAKYYIKSIDSESLEEYKDFFKRLSNGQI